MVPTDPTRRPAALRSLAVVLAALAAVVSALTLTASPAAASTDSEEATLFELHNGARAASGLAPLVYDPAATAVARAWANELARSGQLRHNPDVAAQVSAQVTRDWRRVGENVGYSGTAAQVHTAYMNSPGHRANILGDYNRVGVGAAYAADGRLWTTVVFVKGPDLAAAAPVAVDPSSVQRLYRAYFRRQPDAAGLDYWVSRLRTGTPLGQISAAFASSPEFVATYGALDDNGFVQLVYRNVLGRSADAAGSRYWVDQLRAHRLDRGGVMVNFSESPEFRAVTAA